MAEDAEQQQQPPPAPQPPAVLGGAAAGRPQWLRADYLTIMDSNYDRFDINDLIGNEEEESEQLTIPQAQFLIQALKKNVSITTVLAELHRWSLSAVSLFIDYIRSNPRLKSLIVGCTFDSDLSEEINESYKAQLDSLLSAIQANPSIQKLQVDAFGNAESIYHLIALSSLSEIYLDVCDIDTTVARSIAAGFSRSASSLKKVTIDANDITVDNIVISGLGAARTVESVTIFHGQPNADTYEVISRLLLYMPVLQELTIDVVERSNDGEGLHQIFLDLPHPACNNLKMLVLKGVSLCRTANWNGGLVEHEAANQGGNKTLRVLRLHDVRFNSIHAVRLLRNIVGLQEFSIEHPRHTFPEERELENEWSEIIRHNTELVKVDATAFEEENSHTFLHGVMEGARNHKSLKKLELSGYDYDSPTCFLSGGDGMRLCRVLREEPTSLQELHLEYFHVDQECIALLAEFLSDRRHQPSSPLRILTFKSCKMDESTIIEILESLLVNQTLQECGFERMKTRDPDNDELRFGGDALAQALSQVLIVNKSLTKLVVSNVDLGRPGVMPTILMGLRQTQTLNSMIFDKCPINTAGMVSLSQFLVEPREKGLQEIGLPIFFNEEQDGEVVGAFLRTRCLERMSPCIKTVHFGHSSTAYLDEESLELLLDTVRENNKNVHRIEGFKLWPGSGPLANSYKTEIEYYLKLNRFGRSLLDSPNIVTSLWPRILSRMTATTQQPPAENAAPLFYFLREYFSRQSNEEQQQQQGQQQPPPQKRARVD